MDDIAKLFNRYLLIFTGAMVAVSVVLLYLPVRIGFGELKDLELRNALEYKARVMEYYLRSYQTNARALASRTMMKKALLGHYQGLIALEGLRQMTDAPYADGCRIYDNLVAAQRLTAARETINSFGDVRLINQMRQRYDRDTVVTLDRALYLYLKNPIEAGGITIGLDHLLFNITHLVKPDLPFIVAYELTNGPCSRHGDSASYAAPVGNLGFCLTGRYRADYRTPEQRLLLVFAIVYALVIAIIVVVLSRLTAYRGVKRIIGEHEAVNRALAQTVEQRELLIKEIHHRVKNNLAMINSMISLMQMGEPEGSVHDKFNVLKGRIESIQLIHRYLYRANDLMSIDLGAYLTELATSIIKTFSDETIVFTHAIDDILCPTDAAISLGIMLAELVTNAMKYGFADAEGKEIALSMRRAGDQFVMRFSNNGRPIPAEVDIATARSMGLMIINATVERLRGTVALSRDGGTVVTITFPAASLQ